MKNLKPHDGPGGVVVGDPHMTTFNGNVFDFSGDPGELYDLATLHNATIHATVKAIGDARRALDRLVVHLPGDITVTVLVGRTEILTPDHMIVVKQDQGHTDPEGDVRPDPLIGVPHLDIGVHPRVGLDGATGLLIDGHQDQSKHKLGITWE